MIVEIVGTWGRVDQIMLMFQVCLGQEVVAVVAEAGVLKLWLRGREGASSHCADRRGSRLAWPVFAVGQGRVLDCGVGVGAAGRVVCGS